MPLRKAVVAAAVIKPSQSPVAKAAVVGAVIKPGRRRKFPFVRTFRRSNQIANDPPQ